jgi:oxygen-dependent protoporphyrinogen oxidase
VVLALPSRYAGPLCRSFDAELGAVLQSIPDAPLVVAALAYPVSDLPGSLDGFGFLVPRGEGPRILGVLWDSCIYPNRAPAGWVLLRAMLGGAHDPKAYELSDDQALKEILRDLGTTMKIAAPPARVWMLRHRHGIPQYALGHPRRLDTIEERRTRWPALAFTGNSYRGISVNHCVEHSISVARETLRHFC